MGSRKDRPLWRHFSALLIDMILGDMGIIVTIGDPIQGQGGAYPIEAIAADIGASLTGAVTISQMSENVVIIKP